MCCAPQGAPRQVPWPSSRTYLPHAIRQGRTHPGAPAHPCRCVHHRARPKFRLTAAQGGECGQNRQSVLVESVGHDLTERWANTVYTGFTGKPLTTDNTAFSRGFYNSPIVTAFLSFVDGQATAAGSVSICEGVAYTSTLEGFRGRGCQQALIQQLLASAQARGCDIAVMQAAPGSASQRNIERAGFRLAHTKVIVSQGQ